MHLQAWFHRETWQLGRALWWLVAVVAVVTFVFVTTPWTTLGLLAALLAVFVWQLRRKSIDIDWRTFPAWAVVGAVMAGYFLVSLSWTADPRQTAISCVATVYLLAVVHLAQRAFAAAPPAWLEHAVRAMLVSYLLAFAYLLSEELTGHAIKRTLFWPFVAARWGASGLHFDQAPGLVKIPATRIKWAMAPLSFLLWPVLLAILVQVGGRAARVMQVLMLAGAAWLIHISDHKTSLAALAIAIAAFAAAHVSAKAVRAAIAAVWVVSFIVIVPLAHYAYQAEWHLKGRVSPSIASRMILWNQTVQRLPERPLLGVGAAATRKLDNDADRIAPAPRPEGFWYPLRTGPHAHNIFLQSWYELGLVGTLLLAVFGLTALWRVTDVCDEAKPYALAAAATMVAMVSASFGLFETWFMGAMAMCAVASALVARHAGQSAAGGQARSAGSTIPA